MQLIQRHLKTKKRIFTVILIFSALVCTLSQCIDKRAKPKDIRGDAFAGADACASCHSSIHQNYLHAAHHLSSRPGTSSSIKGSFHKDSNNYHYNNDVKVVMEQRDSGFYQVAYQTGVEKQANRMDLVIGSGRKAQTYLYWLDDKIFQLPVSWFVPVKRWVNSPGYPPRQVRFDRNIPIGCFECHSSHIRLTRNEAAGDRIINNFDRNSIIYGIDCERCHGPAAKHVSFHQDEPAEKQAKFIVSYSALNRQQQVDMCALCHSGMQQQVKPGFKFRPGELLANNYFTTIKNQDPAELDVHGNQTQLLMASACFIKSKTLTCTSCHNTHVNERDDLPLFSRRCMNCHSEGKNNFCRKAHELGPEIINNCIDCHMPEQPSKLITLLSNGQPNPIANKVRTHLIKVYSNR